MHTLEHGQKFERYRILRCLGKGTAGVSYEAEDTRQQRAVTLKIVHPHALLPDSARRQFFRDMQRISSLAHALLLPVLNYGEVNGQLFIARPYLSAGSLLSSQGRLWFNPPLPIATVQAYALQMAHALTYIHEHGYMHGSLTLSNLLVASVPQENSSASLVLTDLGQAMFVRMHGQAQPTLFSPMAAPEQFHNQHIAASDQYALAVLLYFWLTGSLPFLGSPEEVKQAKLQTLFPALRTYNTQFTERHEHVIRRALQANPADRYATISNFIAAFVQAFAHTHVPPHALPVVDVQDVPPAQEDTDPVSRLPQGNGEQSDTTESNQSPRRTTEPLAPIPLVQFALPDASLIITLPYQAEARQYRITQEETTLGRAGSSDVLLDQDETTSRHHALVVRREQHYCIYDQRSMYGVRVNSHTVREGEGYPLENGDRIFIGDYTLIFYLILPSVNKTVREESQMI